MAELAWNIASTVIFLFEEHAEVPIGTAFIIEYPVPGRQGLRVPLVVTAKHVLGDREAVTARFTSKSGTEPIFAGYPLRIFRRQADLWEHPDEGVDLVVFRTPHLDETVYVPIPFEAIASRQTYVEEDINATDRVIFPCLLSNFMGTTRNYPVIRDGSIALVPEEPVPIEIEIGPRKIPTDQEVILIDATSIPGASGSPIFLWPGPRLKRGAFDVGGDTPWLLGVMHGFYLAKPRDVVGREASWLALGFQENTGIAIVFPSWRLLEILELEEVGKRIRELTN